MTLEPLEDRRLLSTVYVDFDAGGTNNGTSWADAYTDLRAALTNANSGDEVWVAEGTYTPSSSGDRSLSFNLKEGVDLYGGFDGSESTLEERDWASHVTTLSGDIGTTGDTSDNSYHVVYASGVTDAILGGFTITAGNAEGANLNDYGGGMFNEHSSSPTLNNVTFAANSAHSAGGGMFNYNSSSPMLTNVTFAANSSAHLGGGMFNYNFCSPTLTNVTFTANSAGSDGGGMSNNNSSSPTLTNVNFTGNSADYEGGGMYNQRSCSPTLTSVTFTGNSADHYGGGMCNALSCSPTLTNVSFTGNSADYEGGGIYSDYSSSATLTNCILWGNKSPTGPEIVDDSGSISTVNYSIVAGGWTGPGNLEADPLFVREPSDGGDGWGDDPSTHGFDESANDDYGDLRLRPGSSAIDGGDPNFNPNDFNPPLVTDQRGVPRVLDGNDDGSAIIDMGPFELFHTDWGDAPAPYPTRLADGGAHHILTGPRLGTERDWEPDGQPGILADGDDTNGSPNDEDGVSAAPLLVPGIMGTTLTVEASAASFLNAWIDYNADGDWDDPGEQMAVDVTLNTGSNEVSFDVPISAIAGLTYARLRLTSYDTGGTLAPTGRADDGEVEDYAWTIENYLDLFGSDAVADTITVWVGSPGGLYHQVDINGTATHYDAAVYNVIRVETLGSNDTITIHATDQDETVTLRPGSVDVVGQTYRLHAANVETVIVAAGSGDDEVTMTGSTGSNRLCSYADYARLADSPRTFSYRVDGFDTVSVEAPGTGRDYAFLYDSPGNDELDADPDEVVVRRDVGAVEETVTTATGFQRVYAYATAGGDDMAALTGSDTARNRFYGYADYSILTESRRSFYFYARGFDSVTADSPGSGTTYAYLHDSSGVDTFEATPTSATMNRAEPWADTTATGFSRVYAYSTRGGDDTAMLTGNADGGNLYRGYPSYSTLTDGARSFYHYARGFRSVTATGSQADTSSDRAYVYDSSGADTLVGSGHSAMLKDTAGASCQIEALYFDRVYARSSDRTTNDTVDVDDSLVYDLIRSGTW